MRLRINTILKSWREKRVFFYPFIWFVCGLFVVLRGSISHLLEIKWADIDIIPIFIIYLITEGQTYKAGCLAFFMGILTDILAPCPLGLFAFIYSAIHLALYHSRRFLDFHTMKTPILLVAVFLLAKWLFLLIIIQPFPVRQPIALIPFILVGVSITITSLITPLIFHVLHWLRGKEGRRDSPKRALYVSAH